MVRIDVDYPGELHTACRHEPSGSRIETDAPRDNQGKGERFSPTDLLATALGSCMLTTMAIAARRDAIPFDGARASIDKHMSAGAPRRVARLVLRLELPGATPSEARGELERIGRGCPVARSLHPDVDLDLHFAWTR